MKKYLLVSIIILSLAIPVFSIAGVPLDTVKANVAKVLDILRDPALKADTPKNRKTKKDKIMNIANGMFDFTELSKRTLAQNWGKLNAGQQKEFVELYKSLLSDTYSDKILQYKNEQIIYGQEKQLTPKTVEIQSTVKRSGGDVPINYRAVQEGNTWKIYDVVIEGVSLISNYRTQFREILANNPAESLLETLRKKVGKG